MITMKIWKFVLLVIALALVTAVIFTVTEASFRYCNDGEWEYRTEPVRVSQMTGLDSFEDEMDRINDELFRDDISDERRRELEERAEDLQYKWLVATGRA